MKDSSIDLEHEARKLALNIAERMQPINSLSYNQGGLQDNKRSVTTLLKDAETIYNWLIKEL